MKAHIATKMTSKKWHQPWLTADIRRKSRKKHRLYRKAKRTNCSADWDAFNETKKLNSRNIKRARVKHINEKIVGGLQEGNSKPFWRFIKSLKQDGIGLPPLKLGGELYTAARDKAGILLHDSSPPFSQF